MVDPNSWIISSLCVRVNCSKPESCFKTSKYEEVYLCEYKTLADVQSGLPLFVEEVYNVKRFHSTGHWPPSEFETIT